MLLTRIELDWIESRSLLFAAATAAGVYVFKYKEIRMNKVILCGAYRHFQYLLLYEVQCNATQHSYCFYCFHVCFALFICLNAISTMHCVRAYTYTNIIKNCKCSFGRSTKHLRERM